MSDAGDAPSTDGRYATAHLANIVAAARDPQHPTEIGPYVIEQLIGEGGMGTVYRARQLEPIRRTVAIKIIKLGMDSREVVTRFESERQALALMDHPNVAKVLDAGLTENGRPYFVMELVAGEPITTFCEREGYDLNHRLDLFKQACEAVQHAHQKAIIHRDLKPPNILVTLQDGKPWVRVIDFGIAKALGQQLTDQSLVTEVGRLMGTPEYMAPEQADARDVDTRSDVYSLGIVLYELISGSLPFDAGTFRSSGFVEIARIIREVDPPLPSTRLANPSLRAQLSQELEWIPLKAMRKDANERYSSVQEMSEDIDNYLSHRPLRAGPESRAYRTKKFLRRNKAGVAAVAAMLALLLTGIAATSWQAIRAGRAEVKAAQERDNAKATLDFLTENVLAGARPERIPDAKVREQIIAAMVTPAIDRIDRELHDRPLIEASVRTAIQGLLKEVGRSDMALPHARAAYELRRDQLGEEHPDTLMALNNYAAVLQSMGRSAEAEPMHRLALERYRRVMGSDDRGTLSAMNNYAFVLDALGRSADAEPLYLETLERRRRALGPDDPNTITSINNYAVVLRSLGRWSDAEPYARESLDRARRVLGEDHPNTIKTMSGYASILRQLGRLADAEVLYREILNRRRRVLGIDHTSTIQATNDIAAVLVLQGRIAEAETWAKQAVEDYGRVQGPDHPNTITAMNNYAHILWSLGRREDSERLFKEALERCRRKQGENHPDTIQSASSYAFVVLSMGRPEEAESLARDALSKAVAQRSLGASHALTKRCAQVQSQALDALGRTSESAALRAQFGLPAATQPATKPA